MCRLIAVVTFALAFGSPCRAGENLPSVSIADMMRIRHLEDAQISPDGRRVAYVLANADFLTNIYKLSLWVVEVENGRRRLLREGPLALHPRWSPAGDHIAFLEHAPSGTSIAVLDTVTGEVVQRVTVPRKTDALAWSPDATGIAFLAPAEAAEGGAVRATDARSESADPDRAEVYLLDRKQGTLRRLSRQDGHVAHFDWSPDGAQIAYARQPSSRLNDTHTTDLYVLTVATGGSRPLVERPGADVRPRWSPDGKQVAFLSQGGTAGWRRPYVACVVPATGGPPRVVSREFDESFGSRSPDSLVWAADGRAVYAPCEIGIARHLYRIDLKTGEVRPVTRGHCVHQTFSFSADGSRMAFALDRPDMPADLVVSPVNDYAPRPVVEFNAQLKERALGAVSVVRWKSKDGTPVEGILVLPANYHPGTQVPLVTYLHGGPSGGFLSGFSPEVRTAPQVGFCPTQVLAGRGYAVFCPNPRGSDGYGRAFRDANHGAWGEGDLDDVLTGIDELVRRKVADPARLAVTGYCYGGYLGLRALTRTDRFKAACLGACFGDLEAVYGQSEIPGLFEAYFGGPPWEARAVYSRCSPLADAHKVRTPTLLFHAEQDPRIPWTQSKQVHTILTRVGTPAELVSYPRGGHTVLEPRMHAETMRRTVLWYDRHLGTPSAASQSSVER